MIVLLSPAKIQNIKPEPFLMEGTQPQFLNEAMELVAQIRRMSPSRLAEMLNINSDLAHLNAGRFSRWQPPFTETNAKPAVQLYNGEVYHGLGIRSMTESQRQYLQEHLRLFSGLYGMLRPFDLIQPYRLDFGDPFVTNEGKTLYEYWSDRVTETINRALDALSGPRVVLNLASGEYIRSVNRKKLNGTIIDVDFLQSGPSGYKTIVVYTKKARGMMTRFVTEYAIEDPELLKGFDSEGYCWHEGLSRKNKLVFVR